MAEAFSDVTLKLSLQVSNNRLERIDVSPAEKSLRDFEARIKAAGARAAAEYQASFDKIRFASNGAAGGFSRFAAETNLAGQAQRAMSVESWRASQAADNSRREIDRVSASQSQSARVAGELTQRTNRLGQSLNKVAIGAAAAAVGYDVLSNATGQHINLLGTHERLIQSTVGGLAAAAGGAHALSGALAAVGVTLSATGLGAILLPLAAGVGTLVYQLDQLRQSNIRNLNLDREIIRRSEQKRRANALEVAEINALADATRRLGLVGAERLGRSLAVDRKKASLTTNPVQVAGNLQQQLGVVEFKLREEIASRERAAGAVRVHSEMERRTSAYGYGNIGFASQQDRMVSFQSAADATERMRQSQEKIVMLERERAELVRGMQTAGNEVLDNRLRDLESLRGVAFESEKRRQQFASMEPKEQQAALKNGFFGIDAEAELRASKARGRLASEGVNAGRSSGELQSQIDSMQSRRSQMNEAANGSLRSGVDEATRQENILDEITAAAEARSEAWERLRETLVDSLKAQASQIVETENQILALGGSVREIRSSAARRATNGGASGSW